MGTHASGAAELTAREQSVLAAVRGGATTAEIAARLAISPRTVESHVAAILRKLGKSSRAGLRADDPTDGRQALPPVVAAMRRQGPMRGRDREAGLLLDRWDAIALGDVAIVVVTGEPGIGKSRLVADVAGLVDERGGRVIVATHDERSAGPVDPVVRALDDAAPPSDVVGSAGVGIDARRERRLRLASAIDRLVELARDAPLLFFIDDLQWATPTTWDLLSELARGTRARQLMVVGTFRDHVGGGSRDAMRALAALRRSPIVDTVRLTGLERDASFAVLGDVGSRVDLDWTVEHAAGNPLFLRELGRSGGVSATLRDSVGERLNGLAAAHVAAGDVLDAAAVVGEPVTPAVVASVLGRAPAEVLEAVQAGVDAAVLVTHGDPITLAFVHAVHADVRYTAIPLVRRSALHAAAARVFAEVGSPAAIRHRCIAATAGDADEVAAAIATARAFADRSAALGDHALAAATYAAVVPLLSQPGATAEDRARCQLAHGRELLLKGDRQGAVVVRRAARAAARVRDAASLADALVALEPFAGASTTVGTPDHEFADLAQAALDWLPADEYARRVSVMAMLGIQRAFGFGLPATGEPLVRAALAEARRLDDPTVLGRALIASRFVGGPFDLEARRAVGEEVLRLGDRHGLAVLSIVGRQQLWWCAREAGDLEEMDRWHADAEGHLVVTDVEQLGQEVNRRYLAGDLNGAGRVDERLRHLSKQIGLGSAFGAIGVELRDAMGLDLGDWAVAALDTATPRYRWFFAAAVARDAAFNGDLARARQLIDDHLADGVDVWRACIEWAGVVSWWSDAVVATGAKEHARRLLPVLDPLAGRLADNGAVVVGSIDRARACLALASGSPRRALDLARSAVVASRRRETPIFLARELVVQAAAARAAGGPTDTVQHLVAESAAIAQRTGAARIRRDAELLGIGDLNAPRAAPTRPTMTARELEVLELVATGMTNRQVGSSLEVSAATVRKHLEHAYAKLGVSTRTAAVRWVFEHDRALGSTAGGAPAGRGQ